MKQLAALSLAFSTALTLPAVAAEVKRGILESDKEYRAPLWDLRLSVNLETPSGESRRVEAFWDGGKIWRFRARADEVGKWAWESECSDTANRGLHGRTGEFLVEEGEVGVQPVRVAAGGRHFERPGGKPFFLLCDTAWNGVLRSRPEDWDRYLGVRKAQGFTAIQFVSTQWRGGRATLDAPVFTGKKRISVNPDKLREMDAKVAAINEAGMVACPVLLWALNHDDPGNALAEDDAKRLVEYLVARWGCHDVIWVLSGDHRFPKESHDRWKRLGRHLDTISESMITLHPSGQNWIGEAFREEAWLDFVSYQSGHGDGDSSLNWHVRGPVAEAWKSKPVRPIVNMEPNYEAHPGYTSKKPHPPLHVRRAAWWSLLVSPPAGLAYGHNSIWVWNDKTGPAENHGNLKRVEPWHAGLRPEGAESMKVIRSWADADTAWTRLLPAQDLLAAQARKGEPEKYVAVAATPDRSRVVAYTPGGFPVRLKSMSVGRGWKANWFDPRTGERQDAKGIETRGELRFEVPSEADWVLEVVR